MYTASFSWWGNQRRLMDRYAISGEKYASKSEHRVIVLSWLAVFALAAFLVFGGFYLLQRKRANLLISKNVHFREYEEPELSFRHGTSKLFVAGKFHGAGGDEGFRPDIGNNLEMENIPEFGNRKVPDSVNLSFCFTSALKRNPDKTASPGVEYEDVFQCSKLLPSTNNIFFLETSCACADSRMRTPAGLNLTSKQACAIYSAAHHNPNRKVVLLFTCRLVPGFYNLTKNWVKRLWDFPNFYFAQVDLEEFYANTSLLEFHREVQTYSKFCCVHQADILRLYVLYLYGGTYMDLDTISLRPLDDLGVNFVGYEERNSVNNAVMHFEPEHGFLELAFSNAMLSYSPRQWTTIGPHMITKMIKKCNVSALSPLHAASCNVTVLPVNIFYAVGGENWSYFYNETLWPKLEEMLNESYVTHYWNHAGSSPLMIGSNQPAIKLAQQHCVGVYNVSGKILS